VSEIFSLYMVRWDLKLFAISEVSVFVIFQAILLPRKTVILVTICTVDRQLYRLTYAREIFALSQKLSSTVGATFGEKRNMCNFQPPVQNLGVPDPQFLCPVISFFGPIMLQQNFSMQV